MRLRKRRRCAFAPSMRWHSLPPLRCVRVGFYWKSTTAVQALIPLVARASLLFLLGSPGRRNWPIRRVRNTCGDRQSKQNAPLLCCSPFVSYSKSVRCSGEMRAAVGGDRARGYHDAGGDWSQGAQHRRPGDWLLRIQYPPFPLSFSSRFFRMLARCLAFEEPSPHTRSALF